MSKTTRTKIWNPTGNRISAVTETIWLLYFWGGVALNRRHRQHPDVKAAVDHVFFAPTDDYETNETARPLEVSDWGTDSGYDKDRALYSNLVGYHHSKIESFTWRSCSRDAPVVEVHVCRNPQLGYEWQVSYRDNASTSAHDDTQDELSTAVLERFFWSVDPSSIIVESLSRPKRVATIAYGAREKRDEVSGEIILQDLRPYEAVLQYATQYDDLDIKMDLNVPAPKNYRTLPDAFNEAFYQV